jgi:integrase
MREIHRLTDRQIRAAVLPEGKPRLLLPDGGGLYLQLTAGKDGVNRSWIFRYERAGQRHDVGLGPLHFRSLQQAREAVRALQIKLLDGGDPFADRQAAQAARTAAAVDRAKAMTFKQCAVACIEAHSDSWRSDEHRSQWLNSLERYVYPVIGDLPVADIDVALVVKTLEPIWKTVPETASRVRGRIEKVLGWAQVRGFRSGDNPARWRGHLQELFAATSKLSPVKHHKAMPYADVPAFMAKLGARDGLAARALEFTILTAARAGEVLGATWSEIDQAAKTWTIPASRMKSGKEHRVPLSPRALAVLAARSTFSDSSAVGLRIFPMGHHGMWRELAALEVNATVHGFRSSFRDWCSERTSYPNDVIEMALAHTVGNKVENAYRRTDLFEKRRRLMNEWARFCASPVVAGAVVPLKSALQ